MPRKLEALSEAEIARALLDVYGPSRALEVAEEMLQIGERLSAMDDDDLRVVFMVSAAWRTAPPTVKEAITDFGAFARIFSIGWKAGVATRDLDAEKT